MKRTFPNMKFALLVGIGGGVPAFTNNGEIRLGHIVVGRPTGTHSGCIQYDCGKAEASHFKYTGHVPAPPRMLINAANKVEEYLEWNGSDALVQDKARLMQIRNVQARKQFEYPGDDADRLFPPDVLHINEDFQCEESGCDRNTCIPRPRTAGSCDAMIVHMVTIATGNAVIKTAVQRDKLSRSHNVLCFDMEASGALSSIECLVVRGISDYCDSHKNDRWQGFASINAAIFARAVLRFLPVDSVTQYQTDLTELSAGISGLQTVASSSQRQSERRHIFEWLKGPDTSPIHNRALESHHDNTSGWLLNQKEYTMWLESSGSFLWLSGSLGCGKTTLVSYIINHLQTTGVAIAYHYLQRNSLSENSVYSDMLRALLRQIVAIRTDLPQCIKDQFAHHGAGMRQASTTTLVKLIDDSVTCTDELFIFIDALDETSGIDSNQIMDWIKKQIEQPKANLHFLLSSRDSFAPLAYLHADHSTLRVLRISRSVLASDILTVVTSWCEKRADHAPNSELWTPANLRRIQSAVEHRSEDMFQWVVSFLKLLEACHTNREIDKELLKVPKDLGKVYNRILYRIDSPKAVELLQLLASCRGRMTLLEAREALATNFGEDADDDILHKDDRLAFSDIVSLCPALLSVNHNYTNRGHGEIRFGHESVREFFVQSGLVDIASFDALSIMKNMVGVCLAYLLDNDMTDQGKQNDVQFPLLHWASSNWFTDALQAAELSPTIRSMIEALFFQHPTAYQVWAQFYNPDGPEHPLNSLVQDLLRRLPKQQVPMRTMDEDILVPMNTPVPLYCAALCGIIPSNMEEASDTDLAWISTAAGGQGWYGNPLIAASARGHNELLPFFAAAIDVNARSHYGSALCAAAANGHMDIVKELVQ
ncbi:Hypothetical protein D9617_7g029460 [Elsinoe fawcettii]|nr:Hypothetical protein D9617_7g029460 [Elsinoe fawcettii]